MTMSAGRYVRSWVPRRRDSAAYSADRDTRVGPMGPIGDAVDMVPSWLGFSPARPWATPREGIRRRVMAVISVVLGVALIGGCIAGWLAWRLPNFDPAAPRALRQT